MRFWIHPTNAGSSVPSMVSDLTESSAAGFPLETLTFGGAPAPDTLSKRVGRAFPTAAMSVCSFIIPLAGTNTLYRSQGYGLTETNSVAVSIGLLAQQLLIYLCDNASVEIAAEDYLARPKCWSVLKNERSLSLSENASSSGLPTPVNDLMVMNGEVCVPAGVIGEVWIRGPNVMKEYWNDQGEF